MCKFCRINQETPLFIALFESFNLEVNLLFHSISTSVSLYHKANYFFGLLLLPGRQDQTMETQSIRSVGALIKRKIPCSTTNLIITIFSALALLILLHIEASSFCPSSSASEGLKNWKAWDGKDSSLVSKLRDSVTFVPLKDLRFAKTAMEGNTWFMSSLNDTAEENEPEHLYFPSEASKGRVLCVKGRDMSDGTKNYYALAWPESLPRSAVLLEGLTFVSDTYYDYENLWHGFSAIAPFVGWSIKNKCAKPSRWVLFHWGEVRERMGMWVSNVTQASFGEVPVEDLSRGDSAPYCFEKAVVMRHNLGKMGQERKLQVSDFLRCRARAFCGLSPGGRGKEVNVIGEPVVRLTLLMRRGSRSFQDPTAVITVFARECAAMTGCMMEVSQSEDLSFCDQVKVMTNTDVVVSPHGAQLTNIIFMDRHSSVMEFFPKGWLELAGVGQYVFRWMADLSGINHTGAWYDSLGKKECPNPQQDQECFDFYKDGKVGHNQTYFAQWARSVLSHVRARKLEKTTEKSQAKPNDCPC